MQPFPPWARVRRTLFRIREASAGAPFAWPRSRPGCHTRCAAWQTATTTGASTASASTGGSSALPPTTGPTPTAALCARHRRRTSAARLLLDPRMALLRLRPRLRLHRVLLRRKKGRRHTSRQKPGKWEEKKIRTKKVVASSMLTAVPALAATKVARAAVGSGGANRPTSLSREQQR